MAKLFHYAGMTIRRDVFGYEFYHFELLGHGGEECGKVTLQQFAMDAPSPDTGVKNAHKAMANLLKAWLAECEAAIEPSSS